MCNAFENELYRKQVEAESREMKTAYCECLFAQFLRDSSGVGIDVKCLLTYICSTLSKPNSGSLVETSKRLLKLVRFH
jgi:hypothetical protein